MPGKKPNSRLRFEQLPVDVRAFVERILGSPVTSARSQAGGFSPGTADRLTGVDGGRVFAKAMSRRMNERSFEQFQLEAQVAESLDGLELPAPALLGCFEHEDWIALVFEDVDGHEPGGGEADVTAVFDALARLPLLPAGIRLPEGERRAEIKFERWSADWGKALDEGLFEALPGMARSHLDELRELAAAAPDAVRGGHLVHMDVRPDNVVIDRAGAAWLVDWPWAVIGAPWVDALTYVLGLAMSDPPSAVERWTTLAPLSLAAPTEIDAAMSAVCGNWFRQSIQPPPPALVGLREFQRESALRTVDWLAHRRGW